ncbi:hypothetical protein [Arcanobacterium pinnipediorum]|uniref:Sensory transduction regulator n=1 Tax=Arcanobacterium pinnipediorum TaxID=1503041 RepID=A0ABY5ALH9_9ACTO|nr:hypothetical protein [Arcanobacterium pinnipediorum]USR80063.1 hypothetical protein NG665_03555 [Arcanobacterium pinnipediorum]
MLGKKNYPHFLKNSAGVMPATASKIAGDEEKWIAAWTTEMALVSSDGQRQIYEWYEFETASWDEDTRILSMTFVEPGTEPIAIKLGSDANDSMLTMIHERVERSIVCQGFADLPSGGVARGQVRRRADETLFIQIIVDHEPLATDLPALNQLETELRDMVGLES